MADVTVEIKYNVKTDAFECTTNAKDPVGLVSDFVRGQAGAGSDNSEPNQRDIYTISLEIMLSGDIFTVTHDCGNKGLRDGILMHFIKNYKQEA